ncbi:MAG: EAL domain-containing protein [Marinobacterium sp.]|nr:EAL domain-containing protein [Marinobacterium sp.]
MEQHRYNITGTTVLDSTAIAIWQYQTEHRRILWGNPAALNLWDCASQNDLGKLNIQPMADALEQAALQQTPVLTLTFPHHGSILRCRAHRTGPGLWLLEQHPDSVLNIQQTSQLISQYLPDGQLLCRSKNARRLYHTEQRFCEHFVDPQMADVIWQQLMSERSYRGQAMVHSKLGPRWHALQIHATGDETPLIEMTEHDLYQYLASDDVIDSLLREQQVIQEHAGVGIAFIRERRIIRCNPRFAEIFDYPMADLIGKLGVEVYEDQATFDAVGAEAYPRLNMGISYSKRLKMRRRNGQLVWCNIYGRMITPGQPDQGFIWIIDDIEDEVQAQQQLQQITHEHQLILEHATIGISVLKNRIITRCNGKFAEIFGYNSEELISHNSRRFYRTDNDYQRVGRDGYRRLRRGQVYEAEELMHHRNGSSIWIELRAKAINPDDLGAGTIWIAVDITRRKRAEIALNEARQGLEERVRERTQELNETVRELHQEIADRRIAEERIRHLAHHDPLTGLPNRNMLEERLASTLQQAERNNVPIAVLFIDLDRFKTINDSLGHQEGDQLLRHAASRFRQCVRSTDIVSRLGGDEFVIILTCLRDINDIEPVVEKIRQRFRQEMQLGLQELIVTLSIGISVFPRDGTEPRSLLKHADAAMYHAKANGRNRYQFFDPQMNAAVSEKISLEHALHQAIRDQQFELYYQPQVQLATDQIVGVEALIRWQHPERGIISPLDFIPLAEETGQILEIGHWVMQEACRTARRWQQQGLPPVRVSVNLSTLQIQDDDFLLKVASVLQETGLEPQWLELEITESSIMRNVDSTVDKLGELSKLGIQLSIDDFGTGYSSLSYLKRFPLDKLKIDRSFVCDIDTDQDDAMICNTIISMAKSLNLSVVAEGAETEAHLTCLRAYGCDIYQGYYFSRPLPTPALEQLLSRHQPGAMLA